MMILDQLLERYWGAAFAEGKEGRNCDTSDAKAQRTLNGIYALIYAEINKPPAVLFDDLSVYQELSEDAKTRTNIESVRDVLDAAVRLMRYDANAEKWRASNEFKHGVGLCKKVIHIGERYSHGEDDNSPYDMDGIAYCGICHQQID